MGAGSYPGLSYHRSLFLLLGIGGKPVSKCVAGLSSSDDEVVSSEERDAMEWRDAEEEVGTMSRSIGRASRRKLSSAVVYV